MKTVERTIYVCEHCGKEFTDKATAEWHEKVNHICPTCEHCYWLYGTEQSCDMGKHKCHYKEKSDKK